MPHRLPAPVHIHYLRPPGDLQVFRQHLVADRPDVKVTLARDMPFSSPVVIDGEAVLDPGADAVWFTFPGRWHDIGRFHRAGGSFTGIYANILTPPVLDVPSDGEAIVWETTDLFLDLWLPVGGGLEILDGDQLDEAEAEGWITRDQARSAREEAQRLTAAYETGEWPPRVAEEWTLERALEAFEDG